MMTNRVELTAMVNYDTNVAVEAMGVEKTAMVLEDNHSIVPLRDSQMITASTCPIPSVPMSNVDPIAMDYCVNATTTTLLDNQPPLTPSLRSLFSLSASFDEIHSPSYYFLTSIKSKDESDDILPLLVNDYDDGNEFQRLMNDIWGDYQQPDEASAMIVPEEEDPCNSQDQSPMSPKEFPTPTITDTFTTTTTQNVNFFPTIPKNNSNDTLVSSQSPSSQLVIDGEVSIPNSPVIFNCDDHESSSITTTTATNTITNELQQLANRSNSYLQILNDLKATDKFSFEQPSFLSQTDDDILDILQDEQIINAAMDFTNTLFTDEDIFMNTPVKNSNHRKRNIRQDINNEASKRSRQAKKERFRQMEMEIDILRGENVMLEEMSEKLCRMIEWSKDALTHNCLSTPTNRRNPSSSRAA